MSKPVSADELAAAIQAHELAVALHPMVDMRSGRIRRLEALARWDHPRYGRIAPEHFVALAEAHSLMLPLTMEVARVALARLTDWRKLAPELGVNLNISPSSLPGDAAMLHELLAQLRASPIPPSAIGLEITENAFFTQPDEAGRVLTELRGAGMRVEIDDFGTGFSSLGRLVEIPADAVKIDRTFVGTMARDHRRQAVVRAGISLAHDLGLEAVAEGVEDRETWDLLRALGCDTAQGYYIARPVAPEDVAEWIVSWTAGLDFIDRSLIGRGLVGGWGATGPDVDILVVDDEPAITEIIRDLLTSAGFNVAVSANGEDALRVVGESTPKVVVLDIQMPIMDGPAFVSAVRERGHRFPIVVMSAGTSADRWAAELGAQGHIRKPFDVADLLKVAERFVTR